MKILLAVIVLLPFFGFLINGLLRKYGTHKSVARLACTTILSSFIASCIVFGMISKGNPVEIVPYFDFINTDSIKVAFSFQIDHLSALFLLIITGIGFLIHLYSTSYMKDEELQHYARYFAYLNLFIFSMLLLVLGANYVIMFIGWEGVGLCSYLLIGFWFKNDNYNYAAKKAFIMNRIGDLGFLLAIFWLIARLGNANYNDVFANVHNLSQTDIAGITLLLFVGAMGKSAQIPLYTWLPDAMAGPTPVSALIHAATMVTAGIYMIARSNLLYSAAEFTQNIVAIVGLATALLAATIAIRQNDIKKVLAYSTVSQLGYMFLGLGVGAYTGAVFHVMTHAFFKALLFLGAGSVIHAMHHEQDIRKMGGLKKYLPITHITFLLACLAISGIPPFSGFFSKDEILAAAFEKNPVYWGIGVATAAMTAFYMFRLYATTFLGKFRGTPDQEHHLHESPAAMTIPLIVLALLSVIGGFVGVPESLGGKHILGEFLSSVIVTEKAHTLTHSTEYMLMGISVAVATIAILFAVSHFSKKPQLEEATGLGKVLENKWYVDELYDIIIVNPLNALGGFFKNIVEKAGIDGLVNSMGTFVNYLSRQIRLVQNGQVGAYILMMVVSTAVILFIWIHDGEIYRFIITKLF